MDCRFGAAIFPVRELRAVAKLWDKQGVWLSDSSRQLTRGAGIRSVLTPCAGANSVTLIKVVTWLTGAFAWLIQGGVRTTDEPGQASFPAGSSLLPLVALQIFPVE